MAESANLLHSQAQLKDPAKQQKQVGISTPLLFAAAVALLSVSYSWSQRWLISGSPTLTFLILLGSSKGYRVLPFVPLWTLITTLNLIYAVSSTSWLLYAFFAAGCYPTIFLVCLFQFNFVADIVRRISRIILKQLHFVNDKIALFDIPALEIDTDVAGLMVIRGLSISLSTLTIVAHGIEVGIKLSDDLELAIQAEKVTIPLFRRIEISDCMANVKGGEYEMTFGNLEGNTDSPGGAALMVEDTPLLKVAAATGNTSRPKLVTMMSRMTDGRELEDSSTKTGLDSIVQLFPDDDHARRQYDRAIKWIEETNGIQECRARLERHAKTATAVQPGDFNYASPQDMRAAICAQLHDKPSIPHPPKRSIKVTTLQNLSPPWVRSYLHRLPMLLRLLLNPLSYFHPVSISSITAAGSGKWITYVLQQSIFKDYGLENSEVRRLEEKVYSWLSDANFECQLAEITGIAQVPFLSAFDIVCSLTIGDVMAYRTLPTEVKLKQIIRLGGADANFRIPSFLLPHHEHLLPPLPTAEDTKHLAGEVKVADGLPRTIQKERDLTQAIKDEANVKMSVHAGLPAVFDQDLLNFTAALVKAAKVVELEKEPSAMDQEVSGFKDFAQNLKQGMRDGMKKAVVDGIVNDRWIAKMVGKITKNLETAQGEVGWAGDLPVKLGVYRLPDGHREAVKVLP